MFAYIVCIVYKIIHFASACMLIADATHAQSTADTFIVIEVCLLVLYWYVFRMLLSLDVQEIKPRSSWERVSTACFISSDIPEQARVYFNWEWVRLSCYSSLPYLKCLKSTGTPSLESLETQE